MYRFWVLAFLLSTIVIEAAPQRRRIVFEIDKDLDEIQVIEVYRKQWISRNFFAIIIILLIFFMLLMFYYQHLLSKCEGVKEPDGFLEKLKFMKKLRPAVETIQLKKVEFEALRQTKSDSPEFKEELAGSLSKLLKLDSLCKKSVDDLVENIRLMLEKMPVNNVSQNQNVEDVNEDREQDHVNPDEQRDESVKEDNVLDQQHDQHLSQISEEQSQASQGTVIIHDIIDESESSHHNERPPEIIFEPASSSDIEPSPPIDHHQQPGPLITKLDLPVKGHRRFLTAAQLSARDNPRSHLFQNAPQSTKSTKRKMSLFAAPQLTKSTKRKMSLFAAPKSTRSTQSKISFLGGPKSTRSTQSRMSFSGQSQQDLKEFHKHGNGFKFLAGMFVIEGRVNRHIELPDIDEKVLPCEDSNTSGILPQKVLQKLKELRKNNKGDRSSSDFLADWQAKKSIGNNDRPKSWWDKWCDLPDHARRIVRDELTKPLRKIPGKKRQ